MNYFDITFLGYGAGLVIAFWFFGLCISQVFAVLRKIGFWCLLLVPFFAVDPGKVFATDFIQLPPGIDYSAVFFDIVALIQDVIAMQFVV